MTTYDVVLAAMFAALIVVLGTIPAIPITLLPVPITLQSMGVMLAGIVLGPKRGVAAVAILIALVAMGLPVLAGGRGGLPVFAGPTAGFLFGFLPAAFVAGLAATRLARPVHDASPRSFALLALAGLVGIVGIDYLCGIVWLILVTGVAPGKAAYGMVAFVPGDVVKALVAASVAIAIRRAHPIEPR